MTRAIALLASLVAIWLVLSGQFEPLFLVRGIGGSVAIVLVASRMRILDEEGVPLGMAFRFAAYIPWLILETIRSNIMVAKIVLNPALPIDPVLHRFSAKTRTELGRFLFANSITFTPGTTTCEIDGGEFLVYGITRDAAESLNESEMVRRCSKVEGSS